LITICVFYNNFKSENIMEFSKQWLNEWVSSDLDTSVLVKQLTDLGLEVDSVKPAAGEFSGVVVGYIDSAVQHPDADRLRCCKVNVGDAELLDIVCGGVNARAGIKVAVAKVGAILAGDFKIKPAKLRGQPSAGMICSATELGLVGCSEVAGGIMELAEDAPVGVDLFNYLNLDDQIIDIELTPNRGDCANIHGIAREISNVLGVSLILPVSTEVDFRLDELPNVTVAESSACPRYCSRIIRNINPNAVTPLWMQERLRRSGLRVVHPVVDVMNYVMLELGQPLHAFDADKITGDLTVRYASEGERIELLDGQTIEFTPAKLKHPVVVVADSVGPQAIAGIMGGSHSGVTAATQSIFLESAFFAPVCIRRAAGQLGLHSDSSYRFERGVDYDMQQDALERASNLLCEIVGGDIGPVLTVVDQAELPQASTVNLRYEQVERVLGVAVAKTKIISILRGLGFTLLNENSPWHFRVPSFRFDIEKEVDLIEEVARVYGYQNIPTALLSGGVVMALPNAKVERDKLITQCLNQLGYSEAITYSFVDAKFQNKVLGDDDTSIKLRNPIAQDLAVMRQSCLPGLLKVMEFNLNRQHSRVRLMEIGKVFHKLENGEIVQPCYLSLLAAGPVANLHWSESQKVVDFYDVKGDIESLLATLDMPLNYSWRSFEHALLHPGQSVGLYIGDERVGLLGSLHPKWVNDLNYHATPVLFELDLDKIGSGNVPQFTQIPRFPLVRRDLSVIIDESVSGAELMGVVLEISDNLLNNVEIFDVYTGEGIDFGKKSVALGLTFVDPSRTLIDSEVDQAMQIIMQGLQSRLSATMRG
jgi:phenylalanyl-tRNA synthetase beta chain